MDGGYGHEDERRAHRNQYGPGSTGFLQTITDSLEDEDEEDRHGGVGGVADHRARQMRIVEKPQLISPDLTSNFMRAGGERFVRLYLIFLLLLLARPSQDVFLLPHIP